MDSDHRTFVTGGGTGGEGIQLWDMRNLAKSMSTINWGTTHLGEPINRTFNAVKFVPGMSMVVAGCTDDVAAKCFNFKTGGSVIQDFYKLQRSCFTIDVSKDGSRMALGDYCGNLQVENLVYASY
jgi:WD40 repeat protein